MGNRLCTLGSHVDQGTPFPYKSHMLKRLQLIPRIQWVACRTVPVTGAGAGHGTVVYHSRCNTVACLTDSGACGGEAGPRDIPFPVQSGAKGSVMHRFCGYRGKLDAKKYQVPPRFPGLRGCTWPIVNSWVKFFPWGTGEGVPFWACWLSSKIDMRRVHGMGTWSWPLLRGAWVPGVQHDGHDLWSVSASSGLHPIPATSSKIDMRPFHGGTYRPRRRAYPPGGQL